MSAAKKSAINLIKSLPDNSRFDDIPYCLYVRGKVERGVAAIDAGQVVSQDEAERRIKQELQPR